MLQESMVNVADDQRKMTPQAKFKKDHPWIYSFYYARNRCRPGHKYHSKGIKCLFTKEEVKELWFRDKASKMKRPSIDRKDSSGDYTKDNCRFIELSVNSGRPHKEMTHCVRGHLFSVDNTRISTNGDRTCRKCRRDARRKIRECSCGSDAFMTVDYDENSGEQYNVIKCSTCNNYESGENEASVLIKWNRWNGRPWSSKSLNDLIALKKEH